MAYIGASPPATALTASDIADGIISEAKMANDAISLAELKAGTDGEIISWDASANPVAVAAGTSGHFLKSQGAGSQPVFAAAGGSWSLLATVTADSASDSDANIDGHFTSDYKIYKLYGHDIVPSAGASLKYTVNRGGTSITAAEYIYSEGKQYMDAYPNHQWTTSSNVSNWTSSATATQVGEGDMVTTANRAGVLETTFYDPLNTTTYKFIKTQWSYHFLAGMRQFWNTCAIKNTAALSGIRFAMSTGNIGGTWRLYGIK